MSTNIAESLIVGKHDDLVVWLTRLIIDLKLDLLGQRRTAAITMARLDEGTRLVAELDRCRRTKKWREAPCN